MFLLLWRVPDHLLSKIVEMIVPPIRKRQIWGCGWDGFDEGSKGAVVVVFWTVGCCVSLWVWIPSVEEENTTMEV